MGYKSWVAEEDVSRDASVAVGITSVVLAQPKNRKCLTIQNTSTGLQKITVVYSRNAAVSGAGKVLEPGDVLTDSDSADYKCYDGQINAISDLADGTVSITER